MDNSQTFTILFGLAMLGLVIGVFIIYPPNIGFERVTREDLKTMEADWKPPYLEFGLQFSAIDEDDHSRSIVGSSEHTLMGINNTMGIHLSDDEKSYFHVEIWLIENEKTGYVGKPLVTRAWQDSVECIFAGSLCFPRQGDLLMIVHERSDYKIDHEKVLEYNSRIFDSNRIDEKTIQFSFDTDYLMMEDYYDLILPQATIFLPYNDPTWNDTEFITNCENSIAVLNHDNTMYRCVEMKVG